MDGAVSTYQHEKMIGLPKNATLARQNGTWKYPEMSCLDSNTRNRNAGNPSRATPVPI